MIHPLSGKRLMCSRLHSQKMMLGFQSKKSQHNVHCDETHTDAKLGHLFWEAVILSVEDALESFDGILEIHILACKQIHISKCQGDGSSITCLALKFIEASARKHSCTKF